MAVPWKGRFPAETASMADELASISLNPEVRASGLVGVEVVGSWGYLYQQALVILACLPIVLD